MNLCGKDVWQGPEYCRECLVVAVKVLVQPLFCPVMIKGIRGSLS